MAALAVEQAELLDTQLNRTLIRFIALGSDQLSYFDDKRHLQETGLRKYVSLRFLRANADGTAVPRSVGDTPTGDALQLADGTVLRGKFAGVTPEGQVLWATDRFGKLPFKLDNIVRFDKPAPAPPPQKKKDEPEAKPDADKPPAVATPAPKVEPPALPPAAPTSGGGGDTNDHITLTNGDQLTGFVETITATELALTVDKQTIKLPWDRIASVALANPLKPLPGVWVSFEGGSHVKVDNLTIDGKSITGDILGKHVQTPAGYVLQVDFATRHRLIRLGDLESTVVSGGTVFGVPMPPRFEPDRASLHAPVSVKFQLPAGALRFAAIAYIDPTDLDWADLKLIVADGKGQLASEHLSAAKPGAQVNVAPRDKTLILTVDEAANGPVRDRLTLDQAVLLVETK